MAHKAVLFDLDGTLVNTLEDLAQATNYALKKLGQPTHSVEDCREMIGNGTSMFAQRALAPDRQNLKADILRLMKDSYNSNCFDRTTVYHGIDETLRKLQSLDMIMAVVTNKDHEIAERIVHHYFGKDMFAAIMGATNGIAIKPQPDAVLGVISSLGLTCDQCLFVGDSDVDIKTGLASGIRPVGVSWGFRNISELLDAGADIIIDSPAEIIDLLT